MPEPKTEPGLKPDTQSISDPKTKIALRAIGEIRPGEIVNLGIGIPTLMMRHLADKLSHDLPVQIQSENGILGMGAHVSRDAADRNLIDAGGGYVGATPGASFFDSSVSFSLIRSGRLDVSFLGAMEVAANGDLANWIIPGKYAPGIGGGMELAQKARRLIITTTHTTRKGEPKILEKCTLPLTAPACVDTIITELAVIDVTPDGLLLREIAHETDIDIVQAKTDAPLLIPENGPGRF